MKSIKKKKKVDPYMLRLKKYEEEKLKLLKTPMSPEEFKEKLEKLAKKYKI